MVFSGKSSSAAPASYEEWAALAEKTLKGAPISSLDHTNEDGMNFPALMTTSDRPQSSHSMMGDKLSSRAARHWVIAQYLEAADDPQILNKMILDEVEGGTERVIFTPDQSPELVASSMDGVMADAISISFDNPADHDAALAALVQIWTDQKTAPNLARGHLGIDVLAGMMGGAADADSSASRLDAIISGALPLALTWPRLGVFTLGGTSLHRAGLTPAEEIAGNLSHMAGLLRALEAQGHAPNLMAQVIEIQLAMDADLYGNIAKARAMRLVMDKFYGAVGIAGDGLAGRLHGVTSDRMLTRIDRETNMLRSGTAMLAMALAGLGVISALPHDWLVGSTEKSRRIARNTHHVLADEAQLSHVADPAQGSYFMDAATTKLAEKSWQLFQMLEAEGGVLSSAGMNMLKAWASAAITARSNAINQGRDALLGITIHPTRDNITPNDKMLDCVVGSAGPRGGAHRPAAIWEELRSKFQQISIRCLMLDVGGGGYAPDHILASSASRWFAAVGVDGVIMAAKDLQEATAVLNSARPDVLVLGGNAEVQGELQEVIDAAGAAMVVPAAAFAKTSEEDISAILHEILAEKAPKNKGDMA